MPFWFFFSIFHLCFEALLIMLEIVLSAFLFYLFYFLFVDCLLGPTVAFASFSLFLLLLYLSYVALHAAFFLFFFFIVITVFFFFG